MELGLEEFLVDHVRLLGPPPAFRYRLAIRSLIIQTWVCKPSTGFLGHLSEMATRPSANCWLATIDELSGRPLNTAALSVSNRFLRHLQSEGRIGLRCTAPGIVTRMAPHFPLFDEAH
jgi:hypothetical protein